MSTGRGFLQYEPGNATRYAIWIVKGFGHQGPDDYYLVALPEWRTCYYLQLKESMLHPAYLEEKLGVTGGDAKVLTELLTAVGEALPF
jgi:hypothetical protein